VERLGLISFKNNIVISRTKFESAEKGCHGIYTMGGEAGTGLEAISVIARLLAVAYLLGRRRK